MVEDGGGVCVCFFSADLFEGGLFREGVSFSRRRGDYGFWVWFSVYAHLLLSYGFLSV